MHLWNPCAVCPLILWIMSKEAGKDADYLIFDEDLLNENPSRFSRISPGEVWIVGEQVNTNGNEQMINE